MRSWIHSRWNNEGLLMRLAYLLGFVAFVRTMLFAFVFDDQLQIVMNPWITAWRFMPLWFSNHLWRFYQDTGRYYRPVFQVYLRVNEQVFGFIPAWWHLSTIAMHLVTVWLVYLVGKKVLNNGIAAAVGALLFAVHPIHIESVAWIAGVTEPLAAALLVWSFLAYLYFRDSGPTRNWWLALSVFAYALAVFAKETSIIFPALVIVYELLMSADAMRERVRRAFWLAVPLGVVSIGYLVARKYAMRYATPYANLGHFDLVVMEWPELIWRYLAHLAWPFGLSFYYEYTALGEITLRNALGYGAALLLAAAAFLKIYRHSPRMLFAALVVLLPIAPILAGTFLWHPSVYLHDRYLYVPSIALCLAAGWAAVQAWQRSPRATVAVVGAIVAVFTVSTIIQEGQWDSDMALFTHAVKCSPHNMLAREDLALAYSSQGDFQSAIDQYRIMLQMRPESWNTMFSWAQTAYVLKDFVTADEMYTRALAMLPPEKQRVSVQQYFYLGMARLEMKKAKEAEEPLRIAIALKPTALGYHSALADALRMQGKNAEADAEMKIEAGNRLIFAKEQKNYGAKLREQPIAR